MKIIIYVYRECYADAYDYERAVGMMSRLYMFRLPVVNGWKFFNA